MASQCITRGAVLWHLVNIQCATMVRKFNCHSIVSQQPRQTQQAFAARLVMNIPGNVPGIGTVSLGGGIRFTMHENDGILPGMVCIVSDCLKEVEAPRHVEIQQYHTGWKYIYS